jgi:hypothetical protein
MNNDILDDDNINQLDNIDQLDIEKSLKYVEKKVEKIKKNKNIKKTEIMTTKAKTKLLENEEKIETIEKELNNDFIDIINRNDINKKDMNLETLFEELNQLNEQIKNIVNIEEGIYLYKQMTQLIKLIKDQLNSYKMELTYI